MTKAFSRPVFYRWLIPVLLEWAAIFVLFAIGFAVHHWLVWALVVIILGSRQQALGLLGHDGAHYTASRNQRLNDFSSAFFCFWPVVASLGDYRRLHLNHHRYLNTERDPELIFKTKVCPERWSFPITRKRMLLYVISDLLGLGLIEAIKSRNLLRMMGPNFAFIPEKSRPPEWKSWAGPLIWLLTVTALLYATGYLFALAIWFLALGTSFGAFLRLRTWTEHPRAPFFEGAPPPTNSEANLIRSRPLQRGAARSPEADTYFVRLSWWQQILIAPHSSWAHYEHHRHPGVPFWRLRELADGVAGDPPRRARPQRTQRLGELFASFEKG